MKVRVAVHGRFHAFHLACALQDAGVLEAVHTTYPKFIARRWLNKDISLLSEPILELRRRFAQRVTGSHAIDADIAIAFAKAVARKVTRAEADILVGWSSALLDAIAPARERGMKIVVERGSTHIDFQTRILKEAYGTYGLAAPPTDPRLIERERREYADADAICVPSRIARQSFLDAGIPETRLIVNPLGVDTAKFQPPQSRPKRDRPKVLFAGNAGIRKGLPTLLQATSELGGRVETVVAGPIEPDFDTIKSRFKNPWTRFVGALSQSELQQAFWDADIFCLPSYEEGFGMVVIEAMATGLPVVISDAIGAGDIVTPGGNGLIVSAGDADGLASQIAILADDVEQRTAMGDAARRAVESGHSWAETGARAIAAYRALLS